jgi:hypothetical protein
MLRRILPRHFDNDFPGNRLAVWIFGLIMFMELGIAATSLVDPRGAIIQGDRIPLDSYGHEAAAVIMTLFAITGLFRLVLALCGIVALIRYRSTIPFLYLLFLILHLGSKGLLFLHPFARTDSTDRSGYLYILAIIVLLGAGLALSLLGRSERLIADNAT